MEAHTRFVEGDQMAGTTSGTALGTGVDLDTLEMMREAVRDFVDGALPESRRLELDH